MHTAHGAHQIQCIYALLCLAGSLFTAYLLIFTPNSTQRPGDDNRRIKLHMISPSWLQQPLCEMCDAKSRWCVGEAALETGQDGDPAIRDREDAVPTEGKIDLVKWSKLVVSALGCLAPVGGPEIYFLLGSQSFNSK